MVASVTRKGVPSGQERVGCPSGRSNLARGPSGQTERSENVSSRALTVQCAHANQEYEKRLVGQKRTHGSQAGSSPCRGSQAGSRALGTQTGPGSIHGTQARHTPNTQQFNQLSLTQPIPTPPLQMINRTITTTTITTTTAVNKNNSRGARDRHCHSSDLPGTRGATNAERQRGGAGVRLGFKGARGDGGRQGARAALAGCRQHKEGKEVEEEYEGGGHVDDGGMKMTGRSRWSARLDKECRMVEIGGGQVEGGAGDQRWGSEKEMEALRGGRTGEGRSGSEQGLRAVDRRSGIGSPGSSGGRRNQAERRQGPRGSSDQEVGAAADLMRVSGGKGGS